MILSSKARNIFIILSGIGVICIITLALCEVYTHTLDSRYKVAVVEYHPIKYAPGTPANTILMENVKRYAKFISEIKENLDLIIFPESTLTTSITLKRRLDMLNCSTIVPNPFDAVDVCESHNQFPEFFTYLACAAKAANVYVIVNLIEQKLCYNNSYYGEYRQCSIDAWNFYNTDVVFDRKGRVVARYRKYHLFGEVWMNRTATPDISIFKTDFGVKFGLFTCFDIMFKQPPMDLVKIHGINNIIYPSMWFSELPFLTALQTQMQWSYEFDTVLLSAGANNRERGSGGTGIFQGKLGAVVYDFSENGVSKVYVASIPETSSNELNPMNEEDIDDLAREMDSFYLAKENLTGYTMKLLDPSKKVINAVLCEDKNESKFCCNFYINTEINERIRTLNPHYSYYMVIFSGIRSFKRVANGGIEVCGIIACTDETSESCGRRFPKYDDIVWPITFTEVSITANFSFEDNKIQYPNSLLSHIRPLPVDAIEWKRKIYEKSNIIERTFNLVKPQNRLLTFGIYGRDFRKDRNLFH